jgi:hypothetical protein
MSESEDAWREEYRVKQKTKIEKRYMALIKNKYGSVYPIMKDSPDTIQNGAKNGELTIIGDIVEREVEV